VVTLGARGAVWASEDAAGHVAAPKVTVVDTTGAGDAFVGVLAAALSLGRSVEDAVGYAVRAASRSVSAAGATASYPEFDC
jgi:ribokinase